MRSLRMACLFVCVSGYSAARASFDLILVADSGQNCIHRYDGDSGTYLGKFGGSFLSGIRSTAMNATTKTLAVATSNGIYEFDYNTGELLNANSSFTSFNELEYSSGTSFVRSIQGASTLAAVHLPDAMNSTSTVSVTAPLADVYRAVGVDSTGDTLAMGTTLGNLYRFSGISSTVEQTLTSAAFVGTAGSAILGTQMLFMQSNGGVLNISSTQTLSGFAGTSAGGLVSGVDVAFGHGRFAWGLGTNGAGGAHLQGFRRGIAVNTGYFAMGSGFALTQVTTPVSLSVVLAPEPGGFAALALGLMAITRRRR